MHGRVVTATLGLFAGAVVVLAVCTDETPTKGIIHVTYETDDEREGIDAILATSSGYGAAVELVGD